MNDAVANIPQPADGKSLTPDDVRPMLEQMVKEAVSHIPVPRDGRDYDPDVLQKAVNDAVANIPQPASQTGDGEYRREQKAGPRKTSKPRLPKLNR